MAVYKEGAEQPGKRTLLLVDQEDFTRECMSELLRRNAKDLDVRDLPSLTLAETDLDGGCGIILINIGGASIWDGSVMAELACQRDRFPGVPVALLSSCQDATEAMEAVRNGVKGYLSPTLNAAQLLAALRLVMAGGIFIAPGRDGPALPGRPLSFRPPRPEDRSRPPSLTPREEEVLAHLRKGKPNKVIAFELNMSENTVKVHVARILKKLNAANRTAVAFLHQGGADLELPKAKSPPAAAQTIRWP